MVTSTQKAKHLNFGNFRFRTNFKSYIRLYIPKNIPLQREESGQKQEKYQFSAENFKNHALNFLNDLKPSQTCVSYAIYPTVSILKIWTKKISGIFPCFSRF